MVSQKVIDLLDARAGDLVKHLRDEGYRAEATEASQVADPMVTIDALESVHVQVTSKGYVLMETYENGEIGTISAANKSTSSVVAMIDQLN
jgi:hypothetical protein